MQVTKIRKIRFFYAPAFDDLKYQIYYSTDKNFKISKTNKVYTKNCNYVIKNLDKDKKYYVKVRAMTHQWREKSDDWGKKLFGKWSKIKKAE